MPLLACLFLLGISSSAFCASDEEITDLTDQGNNYLVRGQPDLAIKELDRAIEAMKTGRSNPKFASAYYYRAVAYEAKKDFTQAINDYNEALHLNPKYLIAYYRRGDLYQKMGRLEDALSDYLEIIELDPKQEHAYNNCGLVYLRRDDYDRAIAQFDKALELSPKLINAHFNRGVAYVNKKDYFQAYSEFSKELEISPSSFNAKHYYRAVFSFFHKEYEKSWQEVHQLQYGGYAVSPVFLEELRKVFPEEQVKEDVSQEKPIKRSWEEEKPDDFY